MLVKVKYFSQSKCDAEDSGYHLINIGLQVVKVGGKVGSLAPAESIPFCTGRKIPISFLCS